MKRTEQGVRQIHLLTWATLSTLWPILTPPGRQIINPYIGVGWGGLEAKKLLHTPHKSPRTDAGCGLHRPVLKAKAFPPLSIHKSQG